MGGSILFGQRIGFSGTPSDLMPRELGQCDYEPGTWGVGRVMGMKEMWDSSVPKNVFLRKIPGGSKESRVLKHGL